jgi:hypothetical protein
LPMGKAVPGGVVGLGPREGGMVRNGEHPLVCGRQTPPRRIGGGR